MFKSKTNFLNITLRLFSQAQGGPRRGEVVLLAQRKLNFADVMIVPQKSFIMSRAEVDIKTTYDFKFSK